MNSFNYNSPILGQMRSGNGDDPYVPYTDAPFKVINGKVQLAEIPDEFHRVQVKEGSTVYNEVQGKAPTTLQFSVDYNLGLLAFHASAEGKTLAFSYFGRGALFFPVDRVWTAQNNGNVTQTLGDIIIAGEASMKNLEQMSQVTANAIAATTVANNAATQVNTTNANIQSAETLRVSQENTRQTNEAGRNTKETQRQTEETARAAAETTRGTNETNRANVETNRVNAESSRTTAESTRGTNETARQSTETSRVGAESTRAAAESARVTAESDRVSAENNRVGAETGRSTAEGARVSNETTRQSNESTRQTQESNRQTNTINAITNLNTVANGLSHKGNYVGATAYVVNNMVYYLGSTYMCILGSTGNVPTNQTYWRKIHTDNWKDVYSTATTYQFGDSVVDSLGQNIYVSIIDSNINQLLTDTSKWQLTLSVASVINTITTTNTNVTNAESARVIAENSRVTAETGRSSAETNRVSAESSRVSAETARDTAETSRNLAEATRTGNETARQTQESTRVSQESVRQTGYNAFKVLEAYNSSTAYVPMNKVTFNGSTYQCILASTNNSPTNTTYWTLIAAKGTDGTGAGTVLSVDSANGDLAVSNKTTNPIITVNSGTAANQLLKLDGNGEFPASKVKQDAANRMVSDTKISTWDSAASTTSVTAVDNKIGTLPNLQTTNKSNVVNAVNELFTNVSNGKTSIASAITGKGVAASGSDTFSQLSTKISSIPVGTPSTGNAETWEVLDGRTFSNNTGIGLVGTIPDFSGYDLGLDTFVDSGNLYGRPGDSGYVNEDCLYVPNRNNGQLLPTNIRKGVNVLGVTGSYDAGIVATGNAVEGDVRSGKTFSNSSSNGLIGTAIIASGTATAASLLAGQTASNSTGAITGTMPNNGAVNITAGASNVIIPAGYHNGSGVVNNVSVPATKVLTGTTIAGTAGSMPDNGNPIFNPTTSNQNLAAGYYAGGQVKGDSNLIAGNIKSGVNIFGVAGNVIQASGSAVASSLLAGQTASNSTGAIIGTMPNRGAIGRLIPTTADVPISAGYISSGTIAGDANLIPANIVAGKSIFGVTGTGNVSQYKSAIIEGNAPQGWANIDLPNIRDNWVWLSISHNVSESDGEDYNYYTSESHFYRPEQSGVYALNPVWDRAAGSAIAHALYDNAGNTYRYNDSIGKTRLIWEDNNPNRISFEMWEYVSKYRLVILYT